MFVILCAGRGSGRWSATSRSRPGGILLEALSEEARRFAPAAPQAAALGKRNGAARRPPHKKRCLRNLCVFQSACEKPESDVREPYTVLLLEVSLYRYARVFGAYSVKGVDAGLNIIGGRDPPRHRRSRASPL